jgi:glycosyltransferase involved in cell wall biosynthesis
MAAGRPVVGTRVGGIPEMVIDGGTGWLVPASEPLALADAIGRLVQDRASRVRMARAARQRAREVFGIGRHGQKLQDCYDRLRLPGAVGAEAESELA